MAPRSAIAHSAYCIVLNVWYYDMSITPSSWFMFYTTSGLEKERGTSTLELHGVPLTSHSQFTTCSTFPHPLILLALNKKLYYRRDSK